MKNKERILEVGTSLANIRNLKPNWARGKLRRNLIYITSIHRLAPSKAQRVLATINLCKPSRRAHLTSAGFRPSIFKEQLGLQIYFFPPSLGGTNKKDCELYY